MNILCSIRGRRFLPYLEGGLRPGPTARLEKHLAGCRVCSDLLSRIRAGHEAGRQFGRLRPDHPACFAEFEEIRAARPPLRGVSPAFALPALLAVVAGLAIIIVVSGRRDGGPPREGVVGAHEAGPRREFTRLSIHEFPNRSRSRVVTEGFVRTVYYDEQEQTLHIKLAEGPHDPAPFVICEIRDVRGLTIPAEGSRVRVYGQARFDAQPGRGWHEVNPVMDIAVLNR